MLLLTGKATVNGQKIGKESIRKEGIMVVVDAKLKAMETTFKKYQSQSKSCVLKL